MQICEVFLFLKGGDICFFVKNNFSFLLLFSWQRKLIGCDTHWQCLIEMLPLSIAPNLPMVKIEKNTVKPV